MRPLTRRAWLAGALAAPLAVRLETAALANGGDGETLAHCMRIEQLAAFAYGTIAASGGAGHLAVMQRFFAHEAKHVAVLGAALEAIGAAKPSPIADKAAADAESRALKITPVFSALEQPSDALGYLLTVEDALLAAWHDANVKLLDFKLLQTATTILTCQAQHAVVLRAITGRRQLPSPLDQGQYPG